MIPDNDYGYPTLLAFEPEEAPDMIVWYVQRSTDGLSRYVGTHGSEGMLSPAQGYERPGSLYQFPEHVGIATVVDY